VPALPTDLQTASGLPLLTARLLERGLSEGDVEKILGGNFLRVFGEIESGRNHES
jgi:membrane dipeptidase